MSYLLDPMVVEERAVKWKGRDVMTLVYHYRGHAIWGATARILADLLAVMREVLVPEWREVACDRRGRLNLSAHPSGLSALEPAHEESRPTERLPKVLTVRMGISHDGLDTSTPECANNAKARRTIP